MARPYKVMLMAGSMDGGGSERQTLNLLRHLDRQRFTPHLFLCYRQGSLLDQVPDDVPVFSFWDHHRCPRVSLPGTIHRMQVRSLRDEIMSRKIDLVYDRTFHMSMLAYPATRGLQCGRVATIVSPPDRDVPSVERRFVAVKRWLLARSYRRANAIVTVSQAVADAAAGYYGIDRRRFQTIHSPIDLQAIQREAATGAEDLVIDPVDVNIACVGRMSEEKGHRFLIEAIDSLRDHPVFDCLHLWMVGDGPLRSALAAQVDELKLERQVHFVGQRPSAVPIIAQCQLVCVPSLYEGLPNVVLESMALGVPVIGTTAGGSPELFGDRTFGELVPPGDSRALASAILQFAEEPESAQAKSIQAKQHVCDRHSIEAVVPQIEQVMLSVVE
ncbi:N-acetylgalactosamine-N,N'-diacetylbacillosaminyl-diphospho-undecaprenol 4-alpha-N-acetylgalactosaminyltransferase [Rosistilla carotiformis]|uniref:N-acetylgalactosamine-N, N'-diacetylbacillosaminyl-diphospho-undecaprenol 4-alpha-N-acetylgalactosaminyltransferase n=1 Tax=Rosistilla carotiformis TaxID=2528017 RepID=A0A518K100_9BACT|nr:glycosyltransferase [Rosistilla carotiformis]QDV71478.1 N-acetylgalactosamine-N,N'-diacetylbacillosaminyl-diphospho-undecaprenol 4-alpha-N-acetylgalactosaminyltransferase [Rosistilla carotiformis]